MKYYGSILLSLLLSTSHAQDIRKLDEMNGFKNFKLNSNVNLYSVYNKYDECQDYTDGFRCRSISKSSYEIFLDGKVIEQLKYYFYNDTIIRIDIVSDYDLFKTITSVFGEPNDKPTKNWQQYGDECTSAYWKGSKVIMDYFCVTKTKDDQFFGTTSSSQSTVTFRVINYQKYVEKIRIDKAKKLTEDLNEGINPNSPSKIERRTKPEECSFETKTETVSLLNQKWYRCGGYGIRETGSLDYKNGNRPKDISDFGDAKYKLVPSMDYSLTRLYIAKNKSRSIIILWKETPNSFYSSAEHFKGPVNLFLQNGEKITCNDRNILGEQNTDDNLYVTFAVFYLTPQEYEKIKSYGIQSLSYKFGDTQSGFQNYIDKTYEELKCDLFHMDKLITNTGYPK